MFINKLPAYRRKKLVEQKKKHFTPYLLTSEIHE